PVATLWAVYELGHRFGMRYLSGGDMQPAEPAKLKLEGLDIVCEPTFKVRAWQAMDTSPVGPETWTLAEHKRLMYHLAKRQVNHVVVPLRPWQPMTPLEISGAKKNSAVLFSGKRFPLDGETAGRTAFPADAKEFDNPDYLNATTPEERTRAGRTIIGGIIAT